VVAGRVGQENVIQRFNIKGISPVGPESGHIRQVHAITRWPLGQVRLYTYMLPLISTVNQYNMKYEVCSCTHIKEGKSVYVVGSVMSQMQNH